MSGKRPHAGKLASRRRVRPKQPWLGLETKTLRLENPPYDFVPRVGPRRRTPCTWCSFSPAPARAALQHRLPTMFTIRGYVEAGGLMSYGADAAAMRPRAVAYADKILKGAKPGDLPLEEPTTSELVINPKTAKALGIEIPPLFLTRADEVIEW